MILNQLEAGALSVVEAAALAGISQRQLRRLRRAYERQGAEALAHGNRGRPPVNAIAPLVRQQVVAVATSRYPRLSQQDLVAILAAEDHLVLSRPTVNRILRAAGIVSPHRRGASP